MTTQNTDGFSFTGRGILDRIDRFTSKAGKEIITLIVRVDGQYAQLVPCKVWGRLVDDVQDLQLGAKVEVSGKLGGREWNGKVYPDVIALQVRAVADAQPKQQPLPSGREELPPPNEEDIPF